MTGKIIGSVVVLYDPHSSDLAASLISRILILASILDVICDLLRKHVNRGLRMAGR